MLLARGPERRPGVARPVLHREVVLRVEVGADVVVEGVGLRDQDLGTAVDRLQGDPDVHWEVLDDGEHLSSKPDPTFVPDGEVELRFGPTAGAGSGCREGSQQPSPGHLNGRAGGPLVFRNDRSHAHQWTRSAEMPDAPRPNSDRTSPVFRMSAVSVVEPVSVVVDVVPVGLGPSDLERSVDEMHHIARPAQLVLGRLHQGTLLGEALAIGPLRFG